MIRSKGFRTGIDLGSGCVKLVRGTAGSRFGEATHLGWEPWPGDPDPEDELCDERRAAEALKTLLERLDLGRRSLGRIVVSIDGSGASMREITMPPLNDRDLGKALPFEARTHLDIERMERPVLAAQILGPADPIVEGGVAQSRVLLVAVPSRERNFPLRVLSKLDLEPEVVDLASLAGLNELFARISGDLPEGESTGLIDLGGEKSTLHLSGHRGGIFSRQVGPGAPGDESDEGSVFEFLETLCRQVKESVFFYRTRQGRDPHSLYLAGGGAKVPGIAASIEKALRIPVEILDPLAERHRKAKGWEEASGEGPRFVQALGLCRWGDSVDV